MPGSLDEVVQELETIGEPYVRATVVWVRRPASGRLGDMAIVRSDGTLHGWIGGACTEPVVRAEARAVLAERVPRLVYLGPEGEFDTGGRPGVRSVPMSCSSEGALEIFMEPVMPRPHVVIVGRSPAVAKLARLLDVMDWRVTVVDEEGKGAGLPDSGSITSGFGDVGPAGPDSVIVATQGHYDEDALVWALSTGAAHVGLVASGRRAATLMDHLRAVGLSEGEISRVRAPAGLDLGRVDHEEIAVAILGELVSLRASGALGDASAAAVVSAVPETALDPVCGMTVETSGARYTHEHAGEMYYFCCPGCRKSFMDDPAAHLED